MKSKSQNNDNLVEIIGVQFGVFSPEEILRRSVVEVKHPDVFESASSTNPKVEGLMDPRMGPIDLNVPCKTCDLEIEGCPGHFGHIGLERPVYHPGFMEIMLKIFRCVCHDCGRLLVYPKEIPEDAGLSEIEKIIKNKKKKYSRCGSIYDKEKDDKDFEEWAAGGCKAYQRSYIKDNLKFFYKDDKKPDDDDEGDDKGKPKMDAAAKKKKKDEKPELTAKAALDILEKITDSDAKKLGFVDPHLCKPSSLIIQIFPVSPPTVRPSLVMDGSKRGEDDLTFKLAEIVKANNNVRAHVKKGSTTDKIMAEVELLQYHVATYINNDFPSVGISQQRSHRAIKSIYQRLVGKEGRLRGNLMGKRVDFTARTVAGPDPNISICELCIPDTIAKKLTYPEIVNDLNIQKMYEYIQNGPNQYPGATKIIKANGDEIDLRYSPGFIELEIGDTVERHLQNGDVGILNRQPTLHKMSMMGHRLRVMPYSTFRLNLAITTPYNADFDGDELNLHVPQSFYTRSEIQNLFMVQSQIISPKNSGPVIGIIQDSLLSASLLSRRNTFIDEEMLMQISMYLNDDWDGEFPKPAIVRPKKLWTGKQVFSLLLPRTLSVFKKSKIHRGKFNPTLELYPQLKEDTVVYIKRGELLSGILDKNTLGTSGGSLIHIIFNDYGPDRVRDFLDQVQRICNYWILHTGFSVGISDCLLDQKEQRDYINELKEMGIQKANNLLENQFKQKDQDKLEENINKILNEYTNNAAQYVQKNISKANSFRAMSDAGSKGNHINISSITINVGQQNNFGKRIGMTYNNRTLPHFKIGDQGPAARGFVATSYYEGLKPYEVFFHTVGGREGLIDTAIKTADTGYTMRRLVKAMENFIVCYDHTVRNESGLIVQFEYGEDGVDPCKLEIQYFDILNKDMQYYHYDEEQIQKEFAKISKDHHYHMTLEQFRNFLNNENQFLVDQKKWLLEKLFEGKRDKYVLSPMSIDRLVEKVLCVPEIDLPEVADIFGDQQGQIYELDSSLVLNPIYIVVEIEKLLKRLYKDMEENLIFKILLKDKLHSIRILYKYRLNLRRFHYLLGEIERIYIESRVQFGEMVGTIAAQSIGEPAQQMTLNTFHLAGVSSRNVTLGVPRLKEIINVLKKPKNPSLTIYFSKDKAQDKKLIKQIKSQISYTVLRDLLDENECRSPVVNIDEEPIELYMEDYYYLQFDEATLSKFSKWMIRLQFDTTIIEEKGLTPASIAHHIQNIFGGDVLCVYSDVNAPLSIVHIRIILPKGSKLDGGDDEMINFMKEIYKNIQILSVCGVPGISKAFMVRDQFCPEEWTLETEGTNFLEILNNPYVDSRRTISNFPTEVQDILGIEAARKSIIDQIRIVMERYGINVQYRHLALLADCMTHRGYMMQISRHGINKTEAGPLTKCTFEETVDMLLSAAIESQYEDLRGVSSRISLGLQAYLGTGSFNVLFPIENKLDLNNILHKVKQQKLLEENATQNETNDVGYDDFQPEPQNTESKQDLFNFL